MKRLFTVVVCAWLALSSILTGNTSALVSTSRIPPSLMLAESNSATILNSSLNTAQPPSEYLAYIAPSGERPLQVKTPTVSAPTTMYGTAAEKAQNAGPYRTTVTVRGVADLKKLRDMGLTVLSTTKNTATVLVSSVQLSQLGKASFLPRNTELVSRLGSASGTKLSPSASTVELAAAGSLDRDGDNLNDLEESWWCTNPNSRDSDNDKVEDGAEVQGLRDWVQHDRTTRPASGKPFAGWPTNQPGCFDSDYDSVPDAVEVYVFGLNPNRESTSRDKFDDGQKLFGLTNCPGSGGGCGYGALPRVVDWGVIFAEMPSWVKPPYDSPFVAAFPDPNISVDPSSFNVIVKALIQGTKSVGVGESKTYGTTVTNGVSKSETNTETWNNWEESSTTTPLVAGTVTKAAIEPSGFLPPDPSRCEATFGWWKVGCKAATIAVNIAYDTCAAGEGDCRAGAQKRISHVKDAYDRVSSAVVKKVSDSARIVKEKSVSAINKTVDFVQKNFNMTQCTVGLPPQFSCDIELFGYYRDQAEEYERQAMYSQFKTDLLVAMNRHQLLGNGLNLSGMASSFSLDYPVAQFPTQTETNGRSWGGEHSTTHTEYEEHSTTESQQFMNTQEWSTAWTTDTVHAADFTFSYRISNRGSDYAREIGDIAFNLYIGDSSTPFYTYYPAEDIKGDGKFHNFMPGETHAYSSRPVPLTLEQMKSIDLGEHIFVVVEDFSFGVDELFYQDALNSGMSVLLDDGIDDGDESVDPFVLPTWGNETVQSVIKRFFPAREDADGTLVSLSTPELLSQQVQWQVHSLTDRSWWNLYIDNLGDGDAAFEVTPAAGNSSIFIRMNADADLDGYNDRTELSGGWDPADPGSHPDPQLLAVTRSVRTGNIVNVTMAFQNTGTYDAAGVEAVMYAPDPVVTIDNNVIGGSGRVRANSRVILGSVIDPVTLSSWRSAAKPYSTGSYVGNSDKVYTFKAENSGNVGSGTLIVSWNDAIGGSGTINFGAGYTAPLPKSVAEGIQIGFSTGAVTAGEVFTVGAHLPKDTFSYTIPVTATNYITPVVVVSYNDPQGNHKFVTAKSVSDLAQDLTPFGPDMRYGVGVEIVTSAPFNAGGDNTVHLVANSPDGNAITAGHLALVFVDETGTTVARQTYTQTFQTGPTIVPATFNVSSFSKPYQAGREYTMLAFLTDNAGNIIDVHGRLLSTFGADPQPILNTAPASWSIGSVVQGAKPQRTISIVNTGLMPLKAVVNSSDPKLVISNASGIITIPPAGTSDVLATLDTTSIPPVSIAMSLTIRTNDPLHQVVEVPVTGTVVAPSGTANAFEVANRPWDRSVQVYGSVSLNNTVTYSHNILPDAANLEPCRVLDGTTLRGMGKYCTDFGVGTTSYEAFGDGRDGVMPSSGNLDYAGGVGIGTAAGTQGSTSVSVVDHYWISRINLGDMVLIHQTQGNGAGNWELNKTASDFLGSGQYTLQKPLKHSYASAQIMRVPQYTDCNVTGTVTPLMSWNGAVGGILAVMCNKQMTVSGSLDATGRGFRGGARGEKSGDETQSNGMDGEGYPRASARLTNNNRPNGNGGGPGDYYPSGVQSACNNGGGGGGGGGNGSTGGRGGDIPNGANSGGIGGGEAGNETLTNVSFGGGGGGGSGGGPDSCGTYGFNGANGGGFVFVAASNFNLIGNIMANGNKGDGTDSGHAWDEGAGGSGAGGSILIRGSKVSIGNNQVRAVGGPAVIKQNGAPNNGGAGGLGRIRIEYCDSYVGSSEPLANAQKLDCYIADKLDSSTVQLNVPDQINNGKTYTVRHGLRLSFPAPNSQLTYVRVLSQTYAVATLDALITNLTIGGATVFSIDIGDDGINKRTFTETFAQPATLPLSNVARDFNAYLGHHQAANGYVDVPIRVTLDRQADVILTNLTLTPGTDVDLSVAPGDLRLGCPGAASCLASEGTSVPISVTVRNTGAQVASSAVVGYYVGDPASGGKLLGNSYVATIPPGSGVTANFNWNTEGYTASQTIYAIIDPPNAIPEALENNNVISQTLYIKTKPELKPASIRLSRTDTVVGEPIAATLVVSNAGETGAPPSTTHLRVVGERADVFTANLPSGNIAPTSTISLQTVFTPTLFGSHILTVTADSADAVTESVESNNVLTRTIFVGLPAQNIDAGGTQDLAYTATRGFGYLNGSTFDFGGGLITPTVRYDGSGGVQYRFDGLQPTRSYHLDASLYQQGDNFTQAVLFDGKDAGITVPMVSGAPSGISLLVPAAAYLDGSLIITMKRQGSGPAYVSQVVLTPIEYVYIDSGGAKDTAYNVSNGFGYLDTNTYASSVTGADAVNTYRSSFSNIVTYRFDKLKAGKPYTVNLTMYDGASSSRRQSVTVVGAGQIAGCTNLAVNSIQRVQCAIDPAQYATDGSVDIRITCDGCTGPRVNEIALEEKTRNTLLPSLSTATPTRTPVHTPTTTPVGSGQTNVSSFSAQWSGNVVQVAWSTLLEEKVDRFEVWRSNTLNPAAWTMVNGQTSQSSCASVTTPFSYGYTDTNVVGGQTYYYKLSWGGDTCGGTSAEYPQIQAAVPGVVTNTPTQMASATSASSATNTSTSTATGTPTANNTVISKSTTTSTATSTPASTSTSTAKATAVESPTATTTETGTVVTASSTPAGTSTLTATGSPSATDTAITNATATISPTTTGASTTTPTGTHSVIATTTSTQIGETTLTATPTTEAQATSTPTATSTITSQSTSVQTLTSTVTPSPTCTLEFIDVPDGSAFYSFVRCLACRNILSGYPCGGEGEPCVAPGNNPYFRPSASITRGQLAKIVSNAIGFSEEYASSTFEDVPVGSTFHQFIERLYSRGVLSGYPCGGLDEPCAGPANKPYFRTQARVTRGQTAKIVANTAGYAEEHTEASFQDVPVGSTFHQFIERLYMRGVISGYPCGGRDESCMEPARLPYFRPGADVTRGQSSKIVSNTFFASCQVAAASVFRK